MASKVTPEATQTSRAGAATKANPLRLAEAQGQAIWLDYIRRSILTGGELKRLVEEDGLSGVTSNPTIFEKAIAGSTDYDEQLRLLLADEPQMNDASLFDAIAIKDIQMATDIVRPVYDRTNGADGFISLEVSPTLARDTAGTIREAQRLWKAVGRPNLMIKVPATPEGIPAVEELLASGVNVNITLMFSMAHYEAVANAYIRGLRRAANPARIASVASFFVSRVDTLADAALQKIGTPEALALQGKIGIANSRVVYQRFLQIFGGSEFAPLRAKGARVQRVLWASTGTKNPKYSDTLYIAELIGADTVNTIPPATMDAFRDHGVVRGATILDSPETAAAQLASLKKVGVDLDAITEQLQRDGVDSFAKSFVDLMAALSKKRAALLEAQVDAEAPALGSIASAVNQRLSDWTAAHFGQRLWAKDPTLWANKSTPEITDRLGWLNLPEVMREQVPDLTSFREQIKSEGYTHAVLLGMGGSSLAPEVFQNTFGNRAGYPRLHVLDSTHPAAVKAVEAAVDLRHTLFIVSSKSGTTTESNSFFFYFWQKLSAFDKSPGRNFIAITDPGTPLQKLGEQRGFRRVFQATPDVGGRYSALTHFGLVPAAVIGVDLHRLLDRAWTMQEACAASVPESKSPGISLGAILGEAARAGRDKTTIFASASLRHFPVWLEQLIAESTGKEGKGIVPVADEEPPADAARYGSDRLFVHLQLAGEKDDAHESRLAQLEAAGHPIVRIALSEIADVGQEFFRWEIAVAAAGAAIGIHPFNQPDVQLAKDLARQAMKKTGGDGAASSTAAPAVDASNVASLRCCRSALAEFREARRLLWHRRVFGSDCCDDGRSCAHST